jgi:hypothetical protein
MNVERETAAERTLSATLAQAISQLFHKSLRFGTGVYCNQEEHQHNEDRKKMATILRTPKPKCRSTVTAITAHGTNNR